MPDALDHRAILATWSDWRPVKGRKVLQLVFEVPLDQQQEVLTRLGAPMPDKAQWVGIALCNPPATNDPPRETRVEQDSASGTNDTKSPARSEAGKLSYAMKDKMAKAATRAGILPKEPRFRRFLVERYDAIDTEAHAIEAVREICGIKSRSEIASNERAFHEFEALEFSYKQWAGLAAEMR